jgi:acyl-CoA thioesterase FadM
MTIHSRHYCRPEWVDYNGHMSEAYYVLVMGYGTDALLDAIGMDAAHRSERGTSVYTTESHVRYLLQVVEGEELEVRSEVIGCSGRAVRIWHELHAGGTLRATEEILALHVSTVEERTTPFPEAVLTELQRRCVEPPPEAGRSIRLRR